MLQILLSTLDEHQVKLFHMSNSIANGDIEPGWKTNIDDATVESVCDTSSE